MDHVQMRTEASYCCDTISTPDSAAKVYFGEALGRHEGDVSDERKYAETICGSAAVQIQNVANGSARVQGMYTLQK